MLPKDHRLPSPRIREIFKTGRRIHGEWIDVLYMRSEEPCRFAFIVSTKISKKAVIRNRIKRLLRESIYHFLPALSSFHAVCIVRKRPTENTQMWVEGELRKLLGKILSF